MKVVRLFSNDSEDAELTEPTCLSVTYGFHCQDPTLRLRKTTHGVKLLASRHGHSIATSGQYLTSHVWYLANDSYLELCRQCCICSLLVQTSSHHVSCLGGNRA